MVLPKPNSSFSIPSLHDGIEIDCRLYYPTWSKQNHSAQGSRFAVLAHPYAPLGGSYDDPVVGIVGCVLIKDGFTVVTFNFRGAGESKGHTSWSGKAELADFVSVVGFTLNLIKDTTVLGGDDAPQPFLLLGGYSYGSMLCSHLPSIQSIVPLFTTPPKGSSEYEIGVRARDVSQDWNGFVEMHEETQTPPHLSTEAPISPHSPVLGPGTVVGGHETPSRRRRRTIGTGSPHHSIDVAKVRHSLAMVRGRLSHKGSDHHESDPHGLLCIGDTTLRVPQCARILVSPLLHPTAGLITMFSDLKFTWRNPAASSGHPSQAAYVDFPKSTDEMPTCAIYGTRDTFTSAKRLRKWVEQQEKANTSFTAYEVDGASHFWSEASADRKLVDSMLDWLSALERHGQISGVAESNASKAASPSIEPHKS